MMKKHIYKYLPFLFVFAVVFVYMLVMGVNAEAAGKKNIKSISVKIGGKNVMKKAYTIKKGKTATLKVAFSPRIASYNITYKSNKTSIAAVNKKGKITAKKAGTAIIRITISGRKYKKKSTWVKIMVKDFVKKYLTNINNEKNTMLIAHRGYSSLAPENTTVAYELAVDKGFYGVECDVRKTKDGRYVIMHDSNINRMCGYDLEIADATLQQLKEHPIINGSNVEKYTGLTIPTLEEYLSILAKNDVIHPIIEIKEECSVEELKEIVQIVAGFDLLDRTYFISFKKVNLVLLKKINGVNKENLQYITTSVNDDILDWCIENKIDLDVKYTKIKVNDVKRMHTAGRQVNVWTVNTLLDAKKLVNDISVDMITTEKYFDI